MVCACVCVCIHVCAPRCVRVCVLVCAPCLSSCGCVCGLVCVCVCSRMYCMIVCLCLFAPLSLSLSVCVCVYSNRGRLRERATITSTGFMFNCPPFRHPITPLFLQSFGTPSLGVHKNYFTPNKTFGLTVPCALFINIKWTYSKSTVKVLFPKLRMMQHVCLPTEQAAIKPVNRRLLGVLRITMLLPTLVWRTAEYSHSVWSGRCCGATAPAV